MIAAPIDVELSVTSWRSVVPAEFGCFKPPSFALADIVSCLGGRRNWLIDFCQNRGESHTGILYAPKISSVRREFQSYRQHRQYAFSSDIKVLSSETVDLPRRNHRGTTRRRTNQGGEIAVEPSDPDSSRSEDDEILEGDVGDTGRKSNAESKSMDDSGGGTQTAGKFLKTRLFVICVSQFSMTGKYSNSRRHPSIEDTIS